MSEILNRLKKNYKHRAKWARKKNIKAFRLYERDIPDYPFIVDLYNDYVVVYFRGNEEIDAEKNHDLRLFGALKEVLNFEEEKLIYLRRDIQNSEFKYEKSDYHTPEFSIDEGELKFKIILGKYVDTGLFLDHRPLRQHLTTISSKKSLNLFCYTGSLSVALAKSGSKVTSVDMSNTYLDWAKDNFKLNDLTPEDHNFFREDVFKFLETDKNRYDTIILDPPTFSASKKMENTLDIQRDHLQLVEGCMKLLNEGGVLYFSNNLRSFKLDESLSEKYLVKDKTHWSIPEDFRDMKIHKLYELKIK